MITHENVLTGCFFADSETMFFAYQFVQSSGCLEVYRKDGEYVFSIHSILIQGNQMSGKSMAVGTHACYFTFNLSGCRLLSDKERVPFDALR